VKKLITKKMETLDHDRREEGVVDQPRMPDFLILGEMRCGTTTLWEMLDRHPQVWFPHEKELHYFDRRMEMGEEWYANWFMRSDHLVAGEATPDYLFCDGACEAIREAIPAAKLIAILRNPAKRAWSHYWHNVRRGRENLSFDKAIEFEAERIGAPDPVVRAHYAYVRRGHYVRRLRYFEEVFGRDSLCVVFLENLVADPGSTMLKVFSHLGLQPNCAVHLDSLPTRNRADYPRWPRFSTLTSRLMKGVRETPFLGMTAEWFSRVSRPLRTYSGEARMPSGLEREIAERFLESDRQLEDWLHEKVPWRR
jgi:hypothetical protein